MRDHAKDEEYFNQRYSADSKYLEKWMDSYQEKISNPEKYNVESYKYSLFIYSFYKFYSGYSLGLDINELLPDIKLIIQNLIETRKERDTNYEDMEYILHFIILFNQIEYLEGYKKLLEKSEDRDFYFDLLMQYLDSAWQISTKKILWPKDIKPLVEVIQLSKTDKNSAVQRLKKYLEKEWFKTLKEGLITNKQLEKGRYRGYWCIESAVLVKVLGLDDTDLRDCKYYPYDMAHFSE